MRFKRTAGVLQLSDLLALFHFNTADLVDELLRELGSLNLVLEQDLVLE